MPDAETVHVLAGETRATTIRDALRRLGRDERVIALDIDLTFGPIDPPDPALRRAWTTRFLCGASHDEAPETGTGWVEATSPTLHPVFWFNAADPFERASFLAFAAALSPRTFDLVEAAGLDFVTARGLRSPWSLGVLEAEDVVRARLYDRRRPGSAEEIAAAAAHWSALRAENAPFRIIRDGTLVSAPLTVFDHVILASAQAEPEVLARLIGRVLSRLEGDHRSPAPTPNHLAVFGRIMALGEAGGLVVSGPGTDMRSYQVRRCGVGSLPA